MRKCLIGLVAVAMIAGCEFFAPPETFTVYYSVNGGTGADAPVDSEDYGMGDTATVASLPAGLVKSEHSLGPQWNTAADGSGTGFAPGATIELESDVTLFAQWTDLLLGEWTMTQVNAFGQGIDIVSETVILPSSYSIEYTVYATGTTTLVDPGLLGPLGMTENPQVIETGSYWRSWTDPDIQPGYTGYYVLDRDGDDADDFVWYSTYFGTVDDNATPGDDSDDVFTPVGAGDTLTMDDGGSVDKAEYTRIP